MENNFKICKMDIADVSKVVALEKELKTSILSKDSILEDLKNINYSYFVLKNEQKTNNIIGYIATSHVIDTMDIISIVIKKNYQRKGLASLLIKYILNFAKINNITNILLEVRITNTPAQKLYEKHGFKIINKRKNYYKNPIEDAIIYKLEL